MAETMSRREFVRLAGVATLAVTASTITGCGAPEEKAEVETPSKTFGGSEMSKRVLVGYATRTGSTTGVAEAVAKTLAQRGFSVDVKPMREHPSLDGYDAVILGSAINGGAWLPEAMSYLESRSTALGQVPFAAFCVHSMNGGSDEKQTRKRIAYLDSVRQIVKPTDEGFFLGKGPDPEDTSLIARWAFKAFGGSGEGDMRDWPKIADWAEHIDV